MTRLEHRVILASAGTGKTFQLTNRYIALLARGVEPSAILATTFTRKAAGEILGRILVRLAKAAGGDAKAVAELQEHADPSLDAARCRALLLRVSGELHRLSILTLDAFFLRIAGGMLLDLDTPPGWSMLDEESDAQLRSDAALDAIAGMSTVEAVALLERLHQGGLSRRVHDELLSTVGTAHGIYLLTHGNRRAWQALRGDGEPLKAPDVERLIEELRGATPPSTKAGKPGAAGKKAMAKELACAERADWKGFLRGGLVKAVIEERGSYARCAIPAETEAVYRALIEHAAAVRFRQIGDRTLAMFDLVERFDQSYEAAKRDAGAYLFDDVPRLLLRQDAAAKLAKLYFRLDGQIDHLLLDEFQDTSMLQFAMIEPILEELMAGTPEGEAGRSVFIVGDVKQSLYGWRGAQAGLLAALGDKWPQLQESTLERTYRSSPVIVEAVNAVFGGLASNPALAECGAAQAVWSQRFREHASARPELAGYARVSVAADRYACNAEAAERVQAILQQAQGLSVGVLVRRNKPIPDIQWELKRRGIESSGEGGNPLTDSPAVAVALSVMHLADHPTDSAARFHIATSPLGAALGFGDHADGAAAFDLAARVRRRFEQHGCADTLAWMLGRCAAAMDGRSFDRFEQLIELAQSYEGEPDLTPGGFAALARERRVESPDRAAVRVMTIHAAKGLEFDAVVLPDLGSPWGLRAGQMLVDQPQPFDPPDAVSCYVEQALLPWSDKVRRVHEACRDRQVVEDLCGLYVAMTRPVHALEMIVTPRETKGHSLSAAGVLRGAFTADGSATGGDVLYELGDANWYERVEARDDGAGAADAKVSLSWPEPEGVALHRVRRQSPSSLEGGQVVRAEDALRSGTTRALALGTLVHHWFELVEWADDPPSEAALREVAAADTDVPEAEVEPMIESFLARLRSGPIAEALQRDAYADRAPKAVRLDVKREWLFAVRDADADGRTILLSGQFDRLVIGRDAEGRAMWADIVDYKTDVARPGDAVGAAARVEHYRPQVEAYRRAAARLLGIAAGQVTARLAFTQLDAVVVVEAGGAEGD